MIRKDKGITLIALVVTIYITNFSCGINSYVNRK